jgi:hypothetical protein
LQAIRKSLRKNFPNRFLFSFQEEKTGPSGPAEGENPESPGYFTMRLRFFFIIVLLFTFPVRDIPAVTVIVGNGTTVITEDNEGSPVYGSFYGFLCLPVAVKSTILHYDLEYKSMMNYSLIPEGVLPYNEFQMSDLSFSFPMSNAMSFEGEDISSAFVPSFVVGVNSEKYKNQEIADWDKKNIESGYAGKLKKLREQHTDTEDINEIPETTYSHTNVAVKSVFSLTQSYKVYANPQEYADYMGIVLPDEQYFNVGSFNLSYYYLKQVSPKVSEFKTFKKIDKLKKKNKLTEEEIFTKLGKRTVNVLTTELAYYGFGLDAGISDFRSQHVIDEGGLYTGDPRNDLSIKPWIKTGYSPARLLRLDLGYTFEFYKSNQNYHNAIIGFISSPWNYYFHNAEAGGRLYFSGKLPVISCAAGYIVINYPDRQQNNPAMLISKDIQADYLSLSVDFELNENMLLALKMISANVSSGYSTNYPEGGTETNIDIFRKEKYSFNNTYAYIGFKF